MLPPGRFVKAGGEVHNGALAPPARTDQGDGLAGTHGEVEVLQDWLAGLVREVYVAKLQRFDVCRVTVWGEVRGTVGAVV